jgi:predicted patatin/cPLA2 family phospholipase
MPETYCVIAPGGGMVAAYHAGVRKAWTEQFGPLNAHRYVANSGGACNFAYEASGQGHLMEPIWRDLVQSGQFVHSLWNIHRRGVMNIDFLVDEEIQHRFPMDVPSLKASSVGLQIGVTHSKEGYSRYFSKDFGGDFLELLRASCAVPYFFGKPVLVDDEYWYDGTIGSVVGIEHARDEQNILIILTRPLRPIGKYTLVRKILRYLLLRNEDPRLQRAVWDMPTMFNETLHEIGRLQDKKNVLVIQPRTKLPMFRIDTSIERLDATIAQGYRDTMYQSKEIELFLKKCD